MPQPMMLLTVDDLVSRLRGYHAEADEAMVRRAHDLAREACKAQRRPSGEPAFMHPFRVAALITELRLDTASVCAGLVHECPESAGVTLDELERLFSKEVALLVDGIAKLSKLEWKTSEDRQAESFRKMLVAMARDLRVLLLKLCDRLDTMRTLDQLPEARREAIARETMDIYAPLANRVGIYWVRAELEDLAFGQLFPEEHRQLLSDMAVRDLERRRYTEKVEDVLRRIMKDNEVPCSVAGRPKNLWGIFSKMQRTGRDLDQIHDIIAFRIITTSIRNCYAALGIVHESFTPIPGRFKDYIAMPKPNRYQSLHTSVIGPDGARIEVQIRTEEMHRICEEGIAAHWEYKEGRSSLSGEDKKKFSWLRQLVEFQQDLKEPVDFLDAVKIDLFSDEVYAFTPKGEVHAFPVGSTSVDFAYAIHSQVGDHCTGARVNGTMVPLRYVLQNGDRVEILTNPNQKPNKDWLKFVKTARARSKIRHHVFKEQRERSRELGRDLLEKELRKHGLSLARAQKQGLFKQAAHHLRVGSDEEVMMQVGLGRLTAAQAVKALLPEDSPGTGGREPRREPRPAPVPPPRPAASGGIRVQNVDGLVVRNAHCCKPVPGDEIIGFITRGRGVTIHKKDCSYARDLDPERCIEVSWEEEARVEHPVALKVECADQPGLLTQMSKAFSDLGVNISTVNCHPLGNARTQNTFHFQVYDLEHLKQVMRALKQIKGVHSVIRL